MLRPILAFASLCMAAFLLAPTVAVVHERVDELEFKRDMPWELWKWTDEPQPPPLGFPTCEKEEHQLYSEVTDWPERIRKNETFHFGGIVQEQDTGEGVDGVEVEIFLNETKTEPGVLLAKLITTDGRFATSAKVPFELEAERYHLVAHALEKRDGCKKWYEHWSDPEIDVTSDTRFLIEIPRHPVVGHPIALDGQLVDEVGAPVPNATVELDVEGFFFPETTRTSADGRFSFNFTLDRTGNRTVELTYDGSEYYDDSAIRTHMNVLSENVVFDEQGAAEGIQVVRSEQDSVSGQVLLANQKRPGAVTLSFEGIEVATCDGCEPVSTAEVETDEDGRFQFTFHVPSSEPSGPFRVAVTGGGLDKTHRQDGVVYVPTTLEIDAEGAGFFSKAYVGNVTLRDDAGEPVLGAVAVSGPLGWQSGPVDANGTFAIAGEPGCGAHDLQAFYNGTGYYMPTNTGERVGVCAFLNYIPGWLLVIPWWVWPLALLVGVVSPWAYRRLRERYATTISLGPPLELAFTHPDDAAQGVVGVREVAVATARLHEPLPDGHRLRVGTHRSMEEVPLEPDLTTHKEIEPETLGEVPVRAEVLDAKGRVVTRRTATLKVVRYAEEIESRYLALRRRNVGEGSDHVSPREFEAWLHQRARDVDPEVLRRLVGLFEEADYGPREATRRELIAYLSAEQTLPEVERHASA